jgi:hypothetical protein
MSAYRTLRIGVVAVLLIALLVAAGRPAQAQSSRPSLETSFHVVEFGERLWNVLVSLFTPTFEQEGMSIDPNGAKGTASPNPPVVPDEGMTIDPDGHR